MRRGAAVSIYPKAKVEIPSDLAMLLGVEDGMGVYCTLVKSEHWSCDEKKLCEHNLWITPLSATFRGEKLPIWKIEFIVGDEPGSFATVAEALRDCKVAFEVGETRTILYNVRAEATVIVLLTDPSLRTVEELNNRIDDKRKQNIRLAKSLKPISYELQLEFPGVTASKTGIGYKAGTTEQTGRLHPMAVLKDIEAVLGRFLLDDYEFNWRVRDETLVSRFRRFNPNLPSEQHSRDEIERLMRQQLLPEYGRTIRLKLRKIWIQGERSPVATLGEKILWPTGTAKQPGMDIPVVQVTETVRQGELENAHGLVLHLPRSITNILDRQFHATHSLDRGQSIWDGLGHAMLVADSSIPALRISFPPPSARIVNIVLETKDEPGALAECARCLATAGINLLETQIYLRSFKHKARWRVFASVSGRHYANLNQNDFAEDLRRDLRKGIPRSFNVKLLGEPKIYEGIETGHSPHAAVCADSDGPVDIKQLLGEEEGDTLEFKGSSTLVVERLLSKDGKTEFKSALMEEGVLKTVAGFLNSRGGTLVIGVLESRLWKHIKPDRLQGSPTLQGSIVFGIDVELQNERTGWDSYQQKLINAIRGKIGDGVYPGNLISIRKDHYEGRTLCVVDVRPSHRKKWYLGGVFYIRNGNQTVPLEPSRIDDYWRDRT